MSVDKKKWFLSFMCGNFNRKVDIVINFIGAEIEFLFKNVLR